jgi:hypothetical protein
MNTGVCVTCVHNGVLSLSTCMLCVCVWYVVHPVPVKKEHSVIPGSIHACMHVLTRVHVFQVYSTK